MLPGEARCQQIRQGLRGRSAGGLGTSKERFSALMWEMLTVENQDRDEGRSSQRTTVMAARTVTTTVTALPPTLGQGQGSAMSILPATAPQQPGNFHSAGKKKKTGPHQPRKTEPDKLWAGIPTQAADFFLLECPAIQMVSSISCFLPHLI